MQSRLGVLAAEATGGSFMQDQFVQGDAIDLCKFNARIEHSVAGFLLLAAGMDFLPGCAQLLPEVGGI
jgi:hypothetical protein